MSWGFLGAWRLFHGVSDFLCVRRFQSHPPVSRRRWQTPSFHQHYLPPVRKAPGNQDRLRRPSRRRSMSRGDKYYGSYRVICCNWVVSPSWATAVRLCRLPDSHQADAEFRGVRAECRGVKMFSPRHEAHRFARGAAGRRGGQDHEAASGCKDDMRTQAPQPFSTQCGLSHGADFKTFAPARRLPIMGVSRLSTARAGLAALQRTGTDRMDQNENCWFSVKLPLNSANSVLK